VGRVETDAGTATNSGIISAPTGAITIAGRTVNQNGIADSTTSVSLNGRIDLIASYGAVGNPNYDNAGTNGSGGPPFLFQSTGIVTLGSESVTRILPDYASTKSVPGDSLPQNSQVNIQGLAIHLGSNATLLAPSGDISMTAGVWPYVNTTGNGTTVNPDGSEESGFNFYFTGSSQQFLYSRGQIYLNPGALINVTGSTDVYVPLSQSILQVQFRGAEFADSPLQRSDLLRGVSLTVDIRKTGTYNGRYWVGTPLGDVTGVAGLVEHNVAQLTAKGGSVTMQAGESIVVRNGATIDVSGGYYRNGGGMVQTTRLLKNGHLVNAADALPDQIYDGIYTGTFSVAHSRWGVTRTFATPWMTGKHYEQGYLQGANGGSLKMTAASMAIDGELLGLTVNPPRGVAASPQLSSLSLTFAGERKFGDGVTSVAFLTVSPTPPLITFGSEKQAAAPDFQLVADAPVALPTSRTTTAVIPPSLLTDAGFGNLSIEAYDSVIDVSSGVTLTAPPRGSVSLTGANVSIQGKITAPGGNINFKTYTISPAAAAEFPLVHSGELAPVPDVTRGNFTLGAAASISTAGLIVDDRIGSATAFSLPLVINGGAILINTFAANLVSGSAIDVSGGAAVGLRGAVTYGNAGSISIRTGKDPGFSTVIGGQLALGSTLSGYSGKNGGSLTIQAGQIQIGGARQSPAALLLPADFFQQGGFTSFFLEGIGAPSKAGAAPDEPTPYLPGIYIAPGTVINAAARKLALVPPVKATPVYQFSPVLRSQGERQAVNISFSAMGSDDPVSTDVLEARGDVVLGQGARITTDPGGTVTVKGQTVTLLGSIKAPGGAITVTGLGSFPLAPDQRSGVTFATPTVHLGASASLSTPGATVYVPDPYGRRLGTVFAGGAISISGNIIAEQGAILDVSGTSGIIDVHPTALGNVVDRAVPTTSGLTSPLWKVRSAPTRIDSDSGSITLAGSEMLFSDATLIGRAGGRKAVGGTLTVSSGRFYGGGSAIYGSDINLMVTQSRPTIAQTNGMIGVGRVVRDGSGAILPGMGYFTADRFSTGGFDALDLGYSASGNGNSTGGNIEFRGPASISAHSSLKLAGGGVILADSTVNLSAPYVALGQAFQQPLNPQDSYAPFRKADPSSPGNQQFFPPTFGQGSLTVTAKLIDVGNLVLRNIGQASLIAAAGDIRGNGSLNIAGDLTLRAGQIYPTTLTTFNIFAYDHGGVAGSVTIIGSGSRSEPLSAGGSLNIFASGITQSGVLRAPFGSITLGWDGTDFDPSTAAPDVPTNPVTGTSLTVPVTSQVTLTRGSVTSVAGWSTATGTELQIPFGLSTDGTSWIDARGVNVTINGVPEKRVSIAGNSVTTEAGSVTDLRGGGVLTAFRWIAGNGGSTDLLGTASGAWNASTQYKSGTLVTYGNKTWSARVQNAGNTPAIGSYWSQVAESYAIIPGYASEFAPYAPFNAGANATALGGDLGYVSNTLKIGDRVYLEATAGLAAGTYTLLPRRYTLLPGAYLVTPTTGSTYGTYTVPEGSTYVAGYRLNEFTQPGANSTLRTQFQVASTSVVKTLASYDRYSGNAFFTDAAAQFNISRVQRLPTDAGYLAIQGNTSMQLRGGVLANAASYGRGAAIDVSSLADIQIIGGSGTATPGATVVLNASTLVSWGAESLLIGGLRTRGATATTVDVRTGDIVLDTPGGEFSAGEIILASKARLAVTADASISANGRITEKADAITVSGNGAFIRVSSDAAATFTRTNTTGSTAPLLTIGAGAYITGAGVTLDSSYGSSFDPAAAIAADTLNLGSGQISILLSPAAVLTGSAVPQHLVLDGRFLQDVQQVSSLTLRSYRTVDVYGAGTFGSAQLHSISILGGGMRGYDQGTGTAHFAATEISLGNPSNVAALTAPAVVAGTLQLDAGTVRLGQNAFAAQGWGNVIFNAASGVLGDGAGTFSTPGNLTMNTPVITGTRGSTQAVTAGGDLLLQTVTASSVVSGDLGAGFTLTGSRVVADTAIELPSGQLTLRATGAGQAVTVSGTLSVAGSAQNFYDLTRYADAGTITLTSDKGDVNIEAGATLSVAGNAGGGNAGTVTVNASQGAFNADGSTLLGSAATGGTTGSFSLDAKTLPSFATLTLALNAGGFFESRSMRIRTGDVVISNPGGQANVSRNFSVSTDAGSITVTGTLDASGATGGKIALISSGNLTIAAGSLLTAHASGFSSAGTGGEIDLEAGAAVNGVANLGSLLDLQANSRIDLGVDAFVPGAYTTPGSSAFFGQFTGTLHLRAPRNAANNDLRISALDSTISGASTILAEGYQIVDLTASGGLITGWRTAIATLPTAGTVQRNVYDSANAFLSTANYNAMQTRLLGADPQALSGVLVIAPGVEIINSTGNLTLGLTNGTSMGTAARNSADWNLSDFRFGPKQAPGILTLRAKGDIVFNNALSDGFTPVVSTGTGGALNGNSMLWLGLLKNVDSRLPTNTQSWSYRITAGADFGAVDFSQVKDSASLGTSGSVLVGQFYPEVPNPNSTGPAPALGSTGLTANTIRISTNQNVDLGTRYQVIRTGTGSITISAGRDVQLRNQFATIYTAGVRIPTPQNLFGTNDFRPPTFFANGSFEGSLGELGTAQQFYGPTLTDETGAPRRIPQWSLAGGEILINAARNIGRYSGLDGSGNLIADSSRQLPENWLYRSGYVDPTTGLVGSITATSGNLVNPSASTTWWVDYSNFFEGVGALGGGNVSVIAGGDIANIDAVIPTTARMQGRVGLNGPNVAPDASKLVEIGGGDLIVKAGSNIDAGIYYVERGNGVLSAGSQITTNSTRTPSVGNLNTSSPVYLDSRTWLPTTLFLGKGAFHVSARSDILLGPVVNAFLLPEGVNNKPWYRTQFSTYSADSSVNVSSFGGSVTHRLAVTLPGSNVTQPILEAWISSQNLFTLATNNNHASYYQPWLRLAESEVARFSTVTTILPPTLRSTAFAGDINLAGTMNLFPSANGTVELAASGGVIGLQPTGIGRSATVDAVAWTGAKINLSDADPASIYSVANPSGIAPLGLDFLSLTFNETGSFSGANASPAVQSALHSANLLHASDIQPLRLYASGGDITGVTLFSPKPAEILAGSDITDVAFYVQNTKPESISVVSAGRDIILFNENSALRSVAANLVAGNFIAEIPRPTVRKVGNGATVTTLALAGDAQISGPGVLEVLAGRNLDLGTGANLADGTGVGIVSIGNFRNPALPFDGADLIAFAGLGSRGGIGPALGLAGSSLDLSSFIQGFGTDATFQSAYLQRLGVSDLTGLSEEQKSVVGLEIFFRRLRDAGRNHATTGSYDAGLSAVSTLLANNSASGSLYTRARDIRTSAIGSITIGTASGGVTMASDIFGNPLTPPGIVTEYGGGVSIFTDQSVNIGQARIFTLRGGDVLIWSTNGDIAAGTAPKTVVTAPPTRVTIDVTSADVKTDLGGLATGGGIGVLASVAGVKAGDVDLVAPKGTVDAGDAGIRSTGNLNIAATTVLNASNVQVGGSTSGVSSGPSVAAPNTSGLTQAGNQTASQNPTTNDPTGGRQRPEQPMVKEEPPSVFEIQVLGYGGGDGGTEEEERKKKQSQQEGTAAP
jgi:hypothetical protein